jgi:hypothetical protein
MDLRAEVLADVLLKVDAAAARQIDELAIKYYARIDTLEARTEELYHRLRLTQPPGGKIRAGFAPPAACEVQSRNYRRHRARGFQTRLVRPPMPKRSKLPRPRYANATTSAASSGCCAPARLARRWSF